MIATHPRLFRLLIILLILLQLACVWCWPLPLRAATVPSLHVFSVNDLGRADLLPGGRVLVVAELRSEDLRSTALQIDAPSDLVPQSGSASSGILLALHDVAEARAARPIVVWTGEVSSTQPINIRVVYQVPPSAPAWDLVVNVGGQAGGVPLAASTVVRVCCVSAPPAQGPPRWRVYMPAVY